MKYLETGDVIKVLEKDGSQLDGAGFYLVVSSEPILNQIVIPDSSLFSEWNNITDLNTSKEIVLNTTELDLRPSKGRIFELVFGIRSKLGGAKVWARVEESTKFLNDANKNADTGSYPNTGFVDEITSPFDEPSMETKFYLVPNMPPTFRGMTPNSGDNIQMKLEGRAHTVVKIPEDSALMEAIKQLKVLYKLVTSTVTTATAPGTR